ncbi:hypothetical protein MBM_07693 [Drepanopeziza brunnea f. sp. 'multigermtubi' MB_m1]|uniref:Uncharacterized protein n=1 Tax=Marssonina brunnea f. sp. multigermtubi (strain MB_m1) TaxID=1072389 RepID=K1WMC5_MARBU|nr:uncharacterized protein MBM_07693 [Drepanopeziza brunnea f. sp. 'multigermtubi' MB_m1]EKD14016.1 hypothetical protein MBM_07693 [Drepanopeziza brunnea f. sp. 'multigermtubi' MB_m1]
MAPAKVAPAKAAYTSSASPRPKVERTSEHEAAAPSLAMAQAPRSLFALFLIALLAMTLVSASHGHGIARATHSAGEEQIFQEMLNSVDPKALRGVLLAATEKYKHGVFQEDRKAMEALHQENAEAATYFLELAKRQSGNITAVSTTESSTVVPVLPSTPVAEPTPTAPGPTPTTPTPGPTSEPQSPNVAVDPTTLPTPPASTSRNQAVEPTASETSPAAQAPASATSTTSPAEEPATTSTNPPAVTSAPNTAPSTPQTSPGQSTDGTFLGGPAAYPFAHPVSIPALLSASDVQYSAFAPPAALFSFGSYVLLPASRSSPSNSSISSLVSSSFTYAPPVQTSIPAVQGKATAPPTTPPPSTYSPPVTPPSSNTSSRQKTTLISYSSCCNSSLPPPMTALPASSMVQNNPIFSNTTSPSSHTTAVTAVTYGPIQNMTSIFNSSSVSDNSTSTFASNFSNPKTAMSSPTGYFFNNYTSGASPTPSSTAGSPAPPSSSNLPAASSSPLNSVSGAAISSSTAVIPFTSIQSLATGPTSSNAATDQSSPSSTLLTEASTNQKPTSAFSITQQIIYTTTLVGGKAITVTSLMVVPGQTDGTAPGPSKTSAAKGSLQTNAGSTPKNVGLGGVLGAFGMVVIGAL